MIYVTGDCRGDFTRFSKQVFPEQAEMTKDDYVIICGDFGGVWNQKIESQKEKWWLDWLQDRPFTFLFVDGNHENFDRLNEYPKAFWCGGVIHKIRPNVIHLKRGQVFRIDGAKVFTFGGAASHDIEDGILELDDPDLKAKKEALDQHHGNYRINQLSWWKEEMPSFSEYRTGVINLKENEWKVDYVISHCGPSSTIALMSDGSFEPDNLTKYFELVRQRLDYKKWFFGHYHMDKAVTDKEIVLYQQIVRIW